MTKIVKIKGMNLEGVFEIFLDDGSKKLATRNLTPGIYTYDEKAFEINDVEYRTWNPHKSKLASAILNGLNTWGFKVDSSVLYLGASTGTTVSHISDICEEGFIFALEYSARSVRTLLKNMENRYNVIPYIGDARFPETYTHLLPLVDVIYCDVAQPNQSELFVKNLKVFLKDDGVGYIAIKARSIDVTRAPTEIFSSEKKYIEEQGFEVIEEIDISTHAKDHVMFVVKKS